jgi:phosphate transport system permease protein
MKEKIARAGFLLCALTAVAGVLLICVYLVVAGAPALWKIGVTDFLFGSVWDGKNGSFGILPFLLTSLVGTAGAVLLGAPVGVLTALFLAKVAHGRGAAVLRAAVSLLAGIPSVVYGLVGLVALVPAIQTVFRLTSGATLLAAIVVLAIMILPTVIHMAETALRSVPKEYEEGSLALGATQTQTIFRVSLPAARSGVTAALTLGVGRAMGEAMAVLMVSGNVANLPVSLFTPVRFLTTAITSEMSYATVGSLWKQALVSIALVLFVLILLVNLILRRCLRRGGEG